MLPKEGYKKIAVILFYLVVGLLFAYLFFKYLFSALLPFLIAYVIAFALQGVIAFLHNRLHFPKKLASLLLVTLTSGLFFLLIYLIVARVYEESRTPVFAVRGRRLNHLTNRPYELYSIIKIWFCQYLFRKGGGVFRCCRKRATKKSRSSCSISS